MYGGVEVEFHSFLISAVDGGEWSASYPDRFTPRERAPSTHWIGGWVGPRAGLDGVAKTKLLFPCRNRVVQPIAYVTTLTGLRRLIFGNYVKLLFYLFYTCVKLDLSPEGKSIDWGCLAAKYYGECFELRAEFIGGWRKLRNEELHNFYYLANTRV
jgi:hypothetical protein